MNANALPKLPPSQSHPPHGRPVPAGPEVRRLTCRAWALGISLGTLTLGLLAASRAAEESPTINPRGREEILVRATHERGEFDGVVLVAEGSRVRFLGAFGPSGPAKDAAALTPQTIFPACSVTKQFTAVLILQLVDAGKLRLESTLGEVLPDFRPDEAGRAITVRQLLTHSSGLPSLEDALPEEADGVEGFYRLGDLDFAHPVTVLQKYARGPLRFEAGTRFNYNNADYWALGAIVERLEGRSFETLLQERLLDPLGMTRSGLCTPAKPLPAGTAEGQVRDPQSGQKGPGPTLHLENFWAAGAMYLSAEDLLRWDVALDEGKLLSPAMQAAMFTPDPKLGFVALSSWVYRARVPGAEATVLLVERQGEIGAFHTLSLRLPEQHGHVLLLSNLDVADLNSTYMRKGLPFDVVGTFFSAPSAP